MDTAGYFPEGKVPPRLEADRSPPSSAEVKKERVYFLSPQAPFMTSSVSVLLLIIVCVESHFLSVYFCKVYLTVE
jgi:hypothetical protein